MTHQVELRARSHISAAELEAKWGRIITPDDYNVVLTGPTRLYRPDGKLCLVYLPGVLSGLLDAAWPTLSAIRIYTDNRGAASGTPRLQRGEQKRTRTRRILSTTVGAVDPGPSVSRGSGRLPICRLTAWTAQHLNEWRELEPVFQAIAEHYAEQVPDRYAAQAARAAATHPDWVIPGTPFTTVTVNNTYSTGVHTDAGDLAEGFSTLAVARRGEYSGGLFSLVRYRVAVDMRHGDLLLLDAHEPHGNTDMTCPHQADPLAKPCPEGCERVSLVSYYRTKVQTCASAATEAAKATAL